MPRMPRSRSAPVTAGLGRMTDQRYFAYGSLVTGDWVIGNPSLNGYMGFTALQRDPSVQDRGVVDRRSGQHRRDQRLADHQPAHRRRRQRHPVPAL